MSWQKIGVVVFSAAALAACGGGGDDVANIDPQGFWSGAASTGYNVDVAVLDNNEVWGIYSSGSTIYGALYGNASTSGNRVTVTGSDFNFLTNSVSSGTLQGTVSSKSNMSLSSSGVSASLSYQSTYDTPASASAISGSWSFIGRSGDYSLVPGTIVIDGSGVFFLNQTNCVTTGSITPRPGGKNVYNVSMTSAGVGCATGYAEINGVAYVDTSSTPNRLLALGLTPSKGDGLIVIGTRAPS
jgi:hypothetical protein